MRHRARRRFNFPVGLWEPALITTCWRWCGEHGLAPGDLIIEVTESAA